MLILLAGEFFLTFPSSFSSNLVERQFALIVWRRKNADDLEE
jgi:hypothetical protein